MNSLKLIKIGSEMTSTEILLATAALEVIKSLINLITSKINTIDGSNIEAMEQVLASMKDAIELEKKIQEAQNEIDHEEINVDDWNSNSNIDN